MIKKLGIALGSGGWRGLAHIGVLKSLSKNNIPIDFIAGSSIGSIVGALYAVNQDIDEIEKIIKSLGFKNIFHSFFKRSFDKNLDINNKFDRFFKNIIGDIKIEDLKIPYCAVVSSLSTGQSVALKKGNLLTAVKASSAIPLLFKPVEISSDYFFDGGITTPIPVDIVKQMGADIVIGVNLYAGIFPINLKNNFKLTRIKSFKMSRYLWLTKLAENNLKSADISLNLKIANEDFGIFSKFLNNPETIDYGYQSTNSLIKEIKNEIKLKDI